MDAVFGIRERGQFLPLASRFMFACSLLGHLRRSLFGCSGKRMFGRPWMVNRDELGMVPDIHCDVLFCLYLCTSFLDGSA